MTSHESSIMNVFFFRLKHWRSSIHACPTTRKLVPYRMTLSAFFLSSFEEIPETVEKTLNTCFLSSFVKFRSVVAEKSKCINQRQWWSPLLTDRPEERKLGRGRCVPASCQVLSKSVQLFLKS